jgi:hypothetical protein
VVLIKFPVLLGIVGEGKRRSDETGKESGRRKALDWQETPSVAFLLPQPRKIWTRPT